MLEHVKSEIIWTNLPSPVNLIVEAFASLIGMLCQFHSSCVTSLELRPLHRIHVNLRMVLEVDPTITILPTIVGTLLSQGPMSRNKVV